MTGGSEQLRFGLTPVFSACDVTNIAVASCFFESCGSVRRSPRLQLFHVIMKTDADATDDASAPQSGLHDIMGSTSGLTIPACFTPLQRVALTANGNLQRLVSSYYNAAVSVTTVHSTRTGQGTYEREVLLDVFGITFARATSTVTINADERPDLVHAIEHQGVAIGQLFRKFDILPHFALSECGPLPATAATAPSGLSDAAPRFWRAYELSSSDGGLRCAIREVISNDLFGLTPAPAATSQPPASSTPASATTPKPSLGDIMAPATTFCHLPDGFTPAQRLLLTANGNVERIFSSFYGHAVELLVHANAPRRGAGHIVDRHVTISMGGCELAVARSTCVVTDHEWWTELCAASDELSVGALFRRFNTMPTFTLHAAGTFAGGFWRQYQLEAAGRLACNIHETFDSRCFDAPYADVS